MKPSAIVLLLCTPFFIACNGPETGGRDVLTPYQGEWKSWEFPFPYRDSEGVANITSITIGGRGTTTIDANFANRGDVTVLLTGAPGTIKVEMRPFSAGNSEELAEEDMELIQLWAYATTSTPKPPDQMDEADRCDTEAGWQNECQIRVYYQGKTQTERSGADLRVTLPSDYIHRLNVVTQDNDADSNYQNRGDVCIEGLRGTGGQIDLESGIAKVVMDRATKELPICPDEQIAVCESNDWDVSSTTTCPCAIEFPNFKVETQDSSAANITVDVPGDLWASFSASNEAPQSVETEHCTAVVDVPTFVPDGAVNQNPWQARGTINPPAKGIANGGYSFTLTSKQCEPVAFTNSPDEFVGDEDDEEERSELRGNILVCTGCVNTCAG